LIRETGLRAATAAKHQRPNPKRDQDPSRARLVCEASTPSQEKAQDTGDAQQQHGRCDDERLHLKMMAQTKGEIALYGAWVSELTLRLVCAGFDYWELENATGHVVGSRDEHVDDEFSHHVLLG
jgi:hypothetical protein